MPRTSLLRQGSWTVMPGFVGKNSKYERFFEIAAYTIILMCSHDHRGKQTAQHSDQRRVMGPAPAQNHLLNRHRRKILVGHADANGGQHGESGGNVGRR